MTTRAAFLDRGPGEARGVITLDGRPERLIIERASDIPCQRLGAVQTARVARVERTLNLAFLQLEDGPDAILPIKPGALLIEGASLEIEIAAAARRDKGPHARLIGPSQGPPRLIAPGPDIEARLKTLAGPTLLIDTSPDARAAADEAEDAAIATIHPIPGGGTLSIEPTRALTAIDVDLANRKGQDAARTLRAANLAAIAEAARLLRLKSLSGLVVIDLAGKGHDGAAMAAAARAAFAPEGPAVSIGPISRFGLFELSLPWTAAPITERLLDPDTNRPTPETCALRLLRALEREGRANPGARLTATAAPEVAAAARPLEPHLTARLGPRFQIRPDPTLPRETFTLAAP